MSDARKVNQAITGYLQQVLGGSVRDSHIHALAMMITGLIRGKSAHFGKIGAKSGTTVKYPSRAKQIQRFNKNPHVNYESHYLPFIEQVIASLGLSEYRLSIDTSQVGRNCLLLTIGLVYKQRVIPLVWTVFKGKKGHSSAATQLALLQKVQDLLPAEAQVILTGDGEFDGTEVVTWLEAQPTWHYACRTAKNSKVRVSKSVTEHTLEDIAPPPGQSCQLNRLYFTQKEVGPVNIAFIWHEQKQEHIYLVTSATSLEQTRRWYKRRFKIETLFADSKSRGFGLDKSGIRHAQRMERFVIAVFIAYIWMIYLGVLVIQNGHLDLIARTDRFTHSLFQLGHLYLDRILEEAWSIPVSLELPHPRLFVHFVSL